MPTLHWIGKDKVINHHLDVPFKTLEHRYGFHNGVQSPTETNSGNKIIHGDNLEALKALLPEYEGRIKCIYIDPPYNTGNESWVYNDNVNDPKIKKWLGQVVGKEAEDLTRHDKWLCMIYPRLKLLHKLLADDGAIFISIDDNEQANLKLICDEVFGSGNFVGNVVWEKSKKGDSKLIAVTHEYITIYSKNKTNLINARIWRQKKVGAADVLEQYQVFKSKENNHQALSKAMMNWYKDLPNIDPRKKHKHYRFSDDRGLYFADNFAGPDDGRESRPRYDIIHPVTGKPCKKPITGWRWEEQKTKEALAMTPPRIHFGIDETTIPCRKSYLYEIDSQPFSSVFYTDGRGATKQVESILWRKAFDFPKSVEILEDLFNLFIGKDDIILDSFAGSGTTAHAVFNLNKQDGGNRKVILIEMEDYAETITAERVKRVIKGYGTTEGTDGSFDYFTLGNALFTEGGYLNETIGIDKLRQYVFYTETKMPIDAHVEKDNPHYMGQKNDTSYYFYYEAQGLTTLDHAFLATMRIKAEQYVIYADNCLLTKEFRVKHHIIFKKIPRDISRF
jgi:adenine-specific DNA-methyltransferase